MTVPHGSANYRTRSFAGVPSILAALLIICGAASCGQGCSTLV